MQSTIRRYAVESEVLEKNRSDNQHYEHEHEQWMSRGQHIHECITYFVLKTKWLIVSGSASDLLVLAL